MEINKAINEYFKLKQISYKSPTGLLSSVFPNTFNPSVFHDDVHNTINNQLSIDKEKAWTIERCLRQVDISRIGDGLHLLLFEMISYLDKGTANLINKEEVIQNTLELLVNNLELQFDKLHFTYFNGWQGKKFSINPDSESYNILRELKIKNVYPINGKKNFIYLEKENEAAGPRIEVFYEANKKSNFKFIEIGSIIFENHRIYKGKPIETTNYASGYAIGYERLLMIKNDLDTIYNCSSFKPLIEITQKYIDQKTFDFLFENYIQLIDFLKSVILILFEDSIYLRNMSNQQEQFFLRLFRKIKQSINIKPFNYRTFTNEFINEVLDIYLKRHSYENNNTLQINNIVCSLIENPSHQNLNKLLK